MRAFRGLLILTGVLMGLWGLWLMRDFRFDQLKSAGFWFAGGIIFHDGILAPIVVLYGAFHMWAIPSYARKPATIGLILWGTLTIAVANVLSGQGGKPDNDTVINRPYVSTWLIMTAVIAIIVGADILRRSRRKIPAETMADESSAT